GWRQPSHRNDQLPAPAGEQNSAYGPTAPVSMVPGPPALGAGRRLANFSHDRGTVGKAHRLARRHEPARLEAAACLERRSGGRGGPDIMSGRLRVMAAPLGAAGASGK